MQNLFTLTNNTLPWLTPYTGNDHGRFPDNEFGGGERDRTDDPLLAKQVLSQLSYTPIKTRGFTPDPIEGVAFEIH